MVDPGSRGFSVELVPWDSPDAEPLKAIRFKVFVEEQKVPEELELDEIDAEALHALAKSANGIACGTARMYTAPGIDGPRARIGRMAVLMEFRGCGCGSALIMRLIDEARRRRYADVELSAQCNAVAFYKKFGFVAVGGIYDDAGIDHQMLVLKLTAADNQ
jgi:ElaA protein